MSHFAKVENGIVTQVIVANQEVIDSGLFGEPSLWIQTSYNTRRGIHYEPNSDTPKADQSQALRKNYASIGYTYDPVRNAFIPPKPFDSWVLDEFSCWWNPPIPMPDDGKTYVWIESTKSWYSA